MSDQEYANGFNRVCHDYLAFGLKLQRQPMPVNAGMTKDQRARALAAMNRQTAEGFQGLENEEAQLKPPANFQAVHAQAMHFYQIQADLWRKWADAMEKQDPHTDALGDQIDTVTAQEWQKVISLLRDAVKDHPEAQQKLSALQQSMPILGDPSHGQASERGYASAWASICALYYDDKLKIPIRSGLSQEAFRRELSARLKYVGAQNLTIAKKERLLQPPPKFATLHQDTLVFYEDQARIWSSFGAATANGDDASGRRISKEMATAVPAQLAKIRADVAVVAPNDQDMELAVEMLERPNGIRHTGPATL